MSYQSVIDAKLNSSTELQFLESQIENIQRGLERFPVGSLSLDQLESYVRIVDQIVHLRTHVLSEKERVNEMDDLINAHEMGKMDLDQSKAEFMRSQIQEAIKIQKGLAG